MYITTNFCCCGHEHLLSSKIHSDRREAYHRQTSYASINNLCYHRTTNCKYTQQSFAGEYRILVVENNTEAQKKKIVFDNNWKIISVHSPKSTYCGPSL